MFSVNLVTLIEIKELLQSLAANKVVEINLIPHNLEKLAAILPSGRTSSDSSIICLHSSCYLLLQKAPSWKLGRILNMPQLEGIAFFQNSQACLKIS